MLLAQKDNLIVCCGLVVALLSNALVADKTAEKILQDVGDLWPFSEKNVRVKPSEIQNIRREISRTAAQSSMSTLAPLTILTVPRRGIRKGGSGEMIAFRRRKVTFW